MLIPWSISYIGSDDIDAANSPLLDIIPIDNADTSTYEIDSNKRYLYPYNLITMEYTNDNIHKIPAHDDNYKIIELLDQFSLIPPGNRRFNYYDNTNYLGNRSVIHAPGQHSPQYEKSLLTGLQSLDLIISNIREYDKLMNKLSINGHLVILGITPDTSFDKLRGLSEYFTRSHIYHNALDQPDMLTGVFEGLIKQIGDIKPRKCVKNELQSLLDRYTTIPILSEHKQLRLNTEICIKWCYSHGIEVNPWYTDHRYSDIDELTYIKNRFPKGPDLSKIRYVDASLHSATHWKDSEWICDLMSKHVGNLSKLTIIDLTAHIGGNTILFGKMFKSVTAVEIDKNAYECLNSNVDLYGLKNVETILGDSTEVYKNIDADIAFLDPQWTGFGYKFHDTLELHMGSIPVSLFTKELLKKYSYVILKLPRNYNWSLFNDVSYCMYPGRAHIAILQQPNAV